MAEVLLLLKRVDLAIQACKKAIELKPLHFGCLSTLGLCYRSKGDSKAAVQAFKEALKVHPGLHSLRRVIHRLEAQGVKRDIDRHLWPRIVETTQALNDNSIRATSPGTGTWPTCEWDVVRVEDATDQSKDTWKYFFRVRVNGKVGVSDPSYSSRASCASPEGGPDVSATMRHFPQHQMRVRSLARYYVLRFVGGQIFPVTRFSNGPRIFDLALGEEYRFSFHLIAGHELLDAAGGMLLERLPSSSSDSLKSACDSSRDDPVGFMDVTLSQVFPGGASSDEVERLQLGYLDVGQLDLRALPLMGGKGSAASSGGK